MIPFLTASFPGRISAVRGLAIRRNRSVANAAVATTTAAAAAARSVPRRRDAADSLSTCPSSSSSVWRLERGASITRSHSTGAAPEAADGGERLRRSLFSVPGCVPKMIAKSRTLGADAVVLDLEDGVPLDKKDEARELVRDALSDLTTDFGRSEVCARINALDTGDVALRDLEALLPCGRLQAVVVPKVETASDVRFVCRAIDALAEDDGEEKPRDVRILAAVESARGILNLREIAECAAADGANSGGGGGRGKLDAIIFASEDYCADVGAIRTPSATELLYARSQVVLTAKAHGLQPIDMVHINFRDMDGLRRECQSGKELGFAGKQAIHPGQIEPIHRAFSPSEDEVRFASRAAGAFEGKPVEVDGVVVDTPVYKWAVRMLRRARAAGMQV